MSFVLKNLNIPEINYKYGFAVRPDEDDVVMNVDSNDTTTLGVEDEKVELEPSLLEPYLFSTRIVVEDQKRATSFYNASPQSDSIETMTDYATQGTLPAKTEILCFWCRHGVDHSPIGCPIKWMNHIIEKNYKSSLTKDEYSMKENVSERKLQDMFKASIDPLVESVSKLSVVPHRKSYFQTDGIFCSFNCTLAFIMDNRHNPIYKESTSLLFHLYEKLIGPLEPSVILPAPHWRLLKTFGGPMSIEEFRSKFNRVCYKYQFTIDTITVMKPLSTVYTSR